MQSANISKPAFELKGTPFTLPVLHLFESNMEAVYAQLEKKVKQAPTFFHNAPLVINLHPLDDAGQIDFVGLISILRGYRFIPVGISGGTKQQQATANAMELAILTTVGIGANVQQTAAEKEPVKEPVQTVHETDEPEKDAQVAQQQEQKKEAPDSCPKADTSESGNESAPAHLVSSPVRSGQRVIAPQGDLIVTTTVSSGAEIMAAGNIHVYGTLRGRALAGIEGDKNARIFCQHLEADLVSIAGIYQINDDFPDELRNTPVQVQIQNSEMHITTI